MQLENTDGSLVTGQFAAASGFITIGDGAATGSISITLNDDSVPEIAASYILRITNVTGGARLARGGEGALTADVVVADSDKAYGVVEFAADSLQSLTSVSTHGTVSLLLPLVQKFKTSLLLFIALNLELFVWRILGCCTR